MRRLKRALRRRLPEWAIPAPRVRRSATPQRVGIVNPGAMGASVAAAARRNGQEIYWASEGRSAATAKRATEVGLRDVGSLKNLCAECTAIISIGPPHGAQAVAEQVAAEKFTGIFIEANSIAPQRTIALGKMLTDAGATFVDGSLVGGPAWGPNETSLYLAGPSAEDVAKWFTVGWLRPRVLSTNIGKASALKICLSAHSKGLAALLAATYAAAEHWDVREALQQQWTEGDAAFAEFAARRVRGLGRKAWRLAGEMDEIAETFRDAGLSHEFHTGAAAIYRRLSGFRDANPGPSLEQVLLAVRGKSGSDA